MSYILDALKKAERERGISKVPTLTTVHDIYKGPRNGSWGIPVAILVVLAAGLAGLAYLWRSDVPEEPGLPDFTVRQETPSPAGGTGNYPDSNASGFSPGQEERSRIPAASDLPLPSPGKVPSPAGTLTDSTGGRQPFNPQEADRNMEGSLSPASESAQPVSPDDNTVSAGEGREAADTFSADIGSDDSLPAIPEADSRQQVLQAALENLSITILMYAQDPADRLVFINGRKYIEGDTIEGLYRIESITPEGAILSYEGEKATLKPQ